jgi:L-asparaginase
MPDPCQRPVVAVYVTGGTIVSRYDNVTHTISPAYNGAELLSAVGAMDFCEVELVDYCSLPGPHLNADTGLKLAREIETTLNRPEVGGVVVAQGTDTLEEMAYLFHLIVDSEKPVVFTGAMKSFEEPYNDAGGNLLGAIQLAASSEARNQGILVYFNQDILSACHVVKSNANSVGSFKSFETGPMGAIYNDVVTFFHPAQPRKIFKVDRLDKDVQLIRAVFGMSPLLLEACVDKGVDGIVLEGLGAGNLPPDMLASVKRAIDSRIPVVMVTRCIRGFAAGIYSYEGGGAQLKQMGVLFGGNLSGLKARVKLMVLCSVNPDPAFITANL